MKKSHIAIFLGVLCTWPIISGDSANVKGAAATTVTANSEGAARTTAVVSEYSYPQLINFVTDYQGYEISKGLARRRLKEAIIYCLETIPAELYVSDSPGIPGSQSLQNEDRKLMSLIKESMENAITLRDTKDENEFDPTYEKQTEEKIERLNVQMRVTTVKSLTGVKVKTMKDALVKLEVALKDYLAFRKAEVAKNASADLGKKKLKEGAGKPSTEQIEILEADLAKKQESADLAFRNSRLLKFSVKVMDPYELRLAKNEENKFTLATRLPIERNYIGCIDWYLGLCIGSLKVSSYAFFAGQSALSVKSPISLDASFVNIDILSPSRMFGLTIAVAGSTMSTQTTTANSSIVNSALITKIGLTFQNEYFHVEFGGMRVGDEGQFFNENKGLYLAVGAPIFGYVKKAKEIFLGI